jgi:sugar phosphate isomerase/epimerase
MRFGITPLQFGPIASDVVTNGVPDFSRFKIVDIVRRAAEMKHISMIELTMDIKHVIPGSLQQRDIAGLAELRDETGLRFTAHLPLWSVELATFNEYVRRGGVECIIDSINSVKSLEPEAYVLHASGALATEFSKLRLPKSVVDLICTLMSAFSVKSVDEIISRTEVDSRRIAVENVEFPFQFTRDVVDECNTSICFDTGHLLTRYSGKESVTEFYRRHRDRITEIHLHDGSYREMNGVAIHDDHRALGRGSMPIRDFLTELVRDDFKGPLVFELGANEVQESLRKVSELVPEALDGHEES